MYATRQIPCAGALAQPVKIYLLGHDLRDWRYPAYWAFVAFSPFGPPGFSNGRSCVEPSALLTVRDRCRCRSRVIAGNAIARSPRRLTDTWRGDQTLCRTPS